MSAEQRPSNILFLATCSLTKTCGGSSHYDVSSAVTSYASPELGNRLLERRNEIRELIKGSRDLEWQGISLTDLEFNRDLAKGQDFGGQRTKSFLPAIHRYQGRFYQALGGAGRQALEEGRHGLLIISGLYGLVRPTESIQLYSCPLSAKVAEIWDKDSLLTDMISAYIERYEVLRVFDMLAIEAYRKLIDWQVIRESGVDVLHCFDVMSSGESALTSLGMLFGSDLVTRTEDGLIGLADGDRLKSTMFRSAMVTPTGFPDELAVLMAARGESPIWQPQNVGDNMREIVRGGNPDVSVSGKRTEGDRWKFTLAKEIRRDLKRQPQLFERTIKAFMDICENPVVPRDNTVKPLQNALRGMWRYRIGDFRVIYEPEADKRIVHFLGLKARAEAYE